MQIIILFISCLASTASKAFFSIFGTWLDIHILHIFLWRAWHYNDYLSYVLHCIVVKNSLYSKITGSNNEWLRVISFADWNHHCNSDTKGPLIQIKYERKKSTFLTEYNSYQFGRIIPHRFYMTGELDNGFLPCYISACCETNKYRIYTS